MFVIRRKIIEKFEVGSKTWTEEHWYYVVSISPQWKLVQTAKFVTTAKKFKTAQAAKAWIAPFIDNGYGISHADVRIDELGE